MTAAITRLDALARASGFAPDDVLSLAERYGGARGVRRLKRALALVDGGPQSPKETWLRLLFHKYGLPPAVTQIPDLGRRLHLCLPRSGLAAVQGRSRVRRRPPPQRPHPVRKGHPSPADAPRPRLDRHLRGGRRSAGDHREPCRCGTAAPRLRRSRRHAEGYSHFRCIASISGKGQG